MAIYFNPGTEKYPLAKLNIGEKATSADIIDIQEMIVNAEPESITLLIVLGSNCVGIESKEKNFSASGAKCKLTFHKTKKQIWDTDKKKYVDALVGKDENYFFVILSDYVAKNPAVGYSGQILPWINPYFWDLINKNTAASSEMAGEIKDKLFALSALTTLNVLTEEDKKKLLDSSLGYSKASGGGYAKPESETEKLAARAAFLMAQLQPVLGSTGTLFELALALPGLDAEMKAATEKTIELTLSLIK